MTIGADLDLQRAMTTRLKASTDLQALIGAMIRLFQDVPPRPSDGTWPAYVTIGYSQRLPDLAECIPGAEIYPDLHIFSRGKGFEEVKRIGAVIIDELHDANLTLAEHRCVEIQLDDERYFVDSDNLTKHGVITFRAKVEPT